MLMRVRTLGRAYSLSASRALAEENFHRLGILTDLVIGVAQIGAHLAAACYAGSRIHALPPSLHIGKLVDVLALPLPAFHHAPAGHVSDGISARDIIAILKALVQDAIETVHLVGVARNRVFNRLGRVAAEMMRLARHRAKAAHLPKQPFVHFHPAPFVLGIELAGLASEILRDGAGLENRDRLSSRAVRIDDRGHAV